MPALFLYRPDGRRVRRQIGYLAEYRLEPEASAAPPALELVDLVSSQEIELEHDETTDE